MDSQNNSKSGEWIANKSKDEYSRNDPSLERMNIPVHLSKRWSWLNTSTQRKLDNHKNSNRKFQKQEKDGDKAHKKKNKNESNKSQEKTKSQGSD